MGYSTLTSTQGYGLYTVISSNTLIKTGPGNIQGILVSSHTTGTIKLWDNTSAATTVLLNTYTYATGSQYIPLFGAKFTMGLFADLGSTTQSTTIIWN